MPMGHRVSERVAVGRPVAEAFALLGDEAHWVGRLALTPEMQTRLVLLEASDGRVDVVTESVVPSEWLPDRVRRHLPVTPGVRRSETWRVEGDRATAVFVFDFSGMPVSASGAGAMVPAVPDECVVSVDLDIAVAVPFVGGLVERGIAPQIGRALRRELAALG
jgi:hypothetical protein